LELTIPDFVARLRFKASGMPAGVYGDYVDESQLLASLVVEALAEQSEPKPLLNPKIIIKLRSESFTDERAKAILLKAHSLASAKGLLYFASLFGDDGKQSAFSASGCRLGTDMSGDWEIDTMRTGCLGCVTVNLAGAVYDSGREKAKFFEVLQERLEMATRALEIKYRTLRQYGEGLLPFLMQDANGEQYLRLEGCSWTVSLVGFGEAVEAFCGKNLHSDEGALSFAEEVVQFTVAYTKKTGRRRGRRIVVAVLPDLEASDRLARLDIERFGVGKVRFSGTREKPFYSTISKLAVKEGGLALDAAGVGKRLRGMHSGGGLAVIDLGEAELKPDELLSLTKQIVEGGDIEFFTYDRKLTYCVNCRKSWVGLLHKCPSCGGVGALAFYDRFASM
jgi:ribonucleoside-triphosphate reductase